jgi:predicted metalloprotease with PDZ domain
LTAAPSGTITDVVWDGAAFKAGLVPGMKIVNVNGVAFNADGLKGAVKAALGSGPSLELAVKKGASSRTVRIEYHDGLRYPLLERIAGVPALLDDILTPRS